MFRKEQGEKQDADLPLTNDWKHNILPEILTNAELLEAVQEGKSNQVEESDSEDDEREPELLSFAQKMQMLDYFKQFLQETSMHTVLPLFHQIESMIYQKASTANKQTDNA